MVHYLKIRQQVCLIFSLEAAILLAIFEKMANNIAASKNLLTATACRVPETTFITL